MDKSVLTRPLLHKRKSNRRRKLFLEGWKGGREEGREEGKEEGREEGGNKGLLNCFKV